MKALVISADAELRRLLAITLRGVERAMGEPWVLLESDNGISGIKLAWRELPDIVVADEITSGAGAFAVAKDLKGAATTFPGGVVIILARREDEWLARWSGADAWLTKPFDPFVLADVVTEVTRLRGAIRESA